MNPLRFFSSTSSSRSRPNIIGLLIDISGNLHVGSTPTPLAVEAFQRLVDSKIPFRLCSNTSKESTASLVKRLRDMGFKSPQPVWTSIGALSQFMKDMGSTEPYLLLSASAQEEVVAATRPHNGNISTYDSVVIGLAPSCFDYAHLDTAFRILKGENGGRRSQVPLIVTHKAKYIQTESGLSLGPGPFVTALESASGVKAHIVGKPTKAFFQMVINDFSKEEIPNHCKGRIAVIGDDVEADLGDGAVDLHLWRVLVKTGKYREGDEQKKGVLPPMRSSIRFPPSLMHFWMAVASRGE
ncbi:HAD-like domain-containing protein [Crassisporium funariophilum]|nr:HAD-like domain-containing protein [Crassisporium funariophilum]